MMTEAQAVELATTLQAGERLVALTTLLEGATEGLTRIAEPVKLGDKFTATVTYRKVKGPLI